MCVCVCVYVYEFPWCLSGKEPAYNARDTGDVGSIPGSGRSPGGGHGNPLQYSCLEDPMCRGAWRATVHGVAKSQTWLKWLSTHTRVCVCVCVCVYPFKILFSMMVCHRTLTIAASVAQRDLVHPWSACFLSVDRPWTCCGFVFQTSANTQYHSRASHAIFGFLACIKVTSTLHCSLRSVQQHYV